MKKFFTLLSSIIILMTMNPVVLFAAGNISSTLKYSQGIGIDIDHNGTDDFINWNPTGGGATVTDSAITGYIWGESLGWINLQPQGGGVTNTCSGALGGTAWASTGAILNFDATGASPAPNINTTTGSITGQVWVSGPHGGWYELASPDGTYSGLVTTWNGCTNGGGDDEEDTTTTTTGNNPNDTDGPDSPDLPVYEPPVTPPVVSPDTAPVTDILQSQDTLAGGQWAFFPTLDILPQLNNIKLDNDISLLLSILTAIGLLGTVPGTAARVANLITTIIFNRKKIRGVVYDSFNKVPLDPVYVSVIDQKTGQEVMNQFTDFEGRFGFVLKSGVYKIIAGKTHYAFPSQKLSGRYSDEVYDHIYFGETFEVIDENKVVAMNIPMDRIETDWNQEEKIKKNFLKYFLRGQSRFGWLWNIMFVAGFLVSVIVTYFYPLWWNIAMTGLYVILAMIQLYGYKPLAYGMVLKNGAPLPYAIIRAMTEDGAHEASHRVVNDDGAYYMLVARGTYILTVEQKNQDGSYTKIFTSEPLTARKGVINKDISIS